MAATRQVVFRAHARGVVGDLYYPRGNAVVEAEVEIPFPQRGTDFKLDMHRPRVKTTLSWSAENETANQRHGVGTPFLVLEAGASLYCPSLLRDRSRVYFGGRDDLTRHIDGI